MYFKVYEVIKYIKYQEVVKCLTYHKGVFSPSEMPLDA